MRPPPTIPGSPSSSASSAAPHLVAVHAPGWQPVVQYPVAEAGPSEPVTLERSRYG
ncbi:DUF5937 family protein [Streptomyces sp. NPDC006290]|uniref:DUF5937 family protein n=1 Tax=Streptomyces sp. NPDC006290 TaxID=3156745 RepID=UPI0033B03DA2